MDRRVKIFIFIFISQFVIISCLEDVADELQKHKCDTTADCPENAVCIEGICVNEFDHDEDLQSLPTDKTGYQNDNETQTLEEEQSHPDEDHYTPPADEQIKPDEDHYIPAIDKEQNEPDDTVEQPDEIIVEPDEIVQEPDDTNEVPDETTNPVDNTPVPDEDNGEPWTPSNKLLVGESLEIYRYLESSNGEYKFTLQGDGNLVLRNNITDSATWASHTVGDSGTRLTLQTDGNLVLYTDDDTPVWDSKTNGETVDELWLKDDGLLGLYYNGNQVWCVPEELCTTNVEDTDGDGVADTEDECPTDPDKSEEGLCGCFVQEGTCNNETPQNMTLSPVADAYVDHVNSTTNYGNSTQLLVDSDPAIYHSFIRFSVPELTAPLTSATLRLYGTNWTPDGPKIYLTDNNWQEDMITWENKPASQGVSIADTGEIPVGWVEIDVTSAISGSGDISFLLEPDSTDGFDFDSREGPNEPELHVITGESTNPTGSITHIGTTEVWDSDGQNVTIDLPSGTQSGDLLILALHRTDDDLPLYVDGWTRMAECYKRDNGYDCSTESDCVSWHNDYFCEDFGGHGGHDLAQAIFYKAAGSNEPSTYTFNLNRDSTGHPGWIILTTLRGADTTNPLRDWSFIGCDDHPDSEFPSVYGETGDMVLLSQSFDDAIAQSKFQAPDGTTAFGYVSNSDEAGFLFGGILSSTGETGIMKTHGDGGPNCKDALVSFTIKPQ